MTPDDPGSWRGARLPPPAGVASVATWSPDRTRHRRAAGARGASWDRDALDDSLASAHLPKLLRAAAKFVFAHPDLVAFDSVATLAERSGVTASAYVRLAHAVSLSGFADMRQIVRRHLLPQHKANADGRDAGQGVAPGRLASVTGRIEQAVSTLAWRVDEARLDCAAELLSEASTVYLVGTRLAFPAVPFIHFAMGHAGVRSVLVSWFARDELDTARVVERRDAAICVDLSPPVDATSALGRALGDRSTPVLTITDDALGATAKASTMVFDVGDAQTPDLAHLAAAMALGQSLTDETYGRDGATPGAPR